MSFIMIKSCSLPLPEHLLYAKHLPFIVSLNPHNNPQMSLLFLTQMEMGKLSLREVKSLSQSPRSSLDTVPHPSDTKS